MRRLGATATVVAVAGVLVAGLPSAASAVPPGGMVLACEDGRRLLRSNGVSWWGLAADGTPDGTVWTTTALLVADLQGAVQHAASYGERRPQQADVCVAQHGPFPEQGDPGSVWTVTLVRVT